MDLVVQDGAGNSTHRGGSGEQEAQGESKLLKGASEGGAKSKGDSTEELQRLRNNLLG